jgi:transcriptional regulator with XRE-family HTH domain
MDDALTLDEPGADDAGESWFSDETATFGDRVAGARDAIGIGQPELARRLGIKLKTLRDWENDVSEPRANKLQMLAGILGVSITWLLTGEGDGVEPPHAGHDTAMQIRDLLLELRTVQTEMDRGAERLARVEKRLRVMLADASRE